MRAPKRRYALSSLIVFLLGCLGGFFVSRSGDDQCVFTVTVESDRPIEAQLFYDSGSDFNEKESHRTTVYQKDQAVVLSFLIPADAVRHLRFDPARSAAAMCIWNPSLSCDGEEPSSIALEKLIPQQGIRLIGREGRGLCFETEGDDPVLLIEEIGTGHRLWLRTFLYSISGGILTLLCAFSVVWLYKRA